MKISALILISLFLSLLFPNSGLKLKVAVPETDTTFIYLKDFGLRNTKKKDCNAFINEAIKSVEPGKPTVLVFTRGEYHFYPEQSNKRNYYESNTTDENPRSCAFLFENMSNVIIEGNGSNLIFHEQMQPFTFDNCKNMVLRNVNIDWEQPLIAQAQILEVKEKSMRISINLKESPFRIEEGKIFFGTSTENLQPWKGTMEFDRKGRYVVPQTGDWGCLGRGWENYLAENILPGTIEIHLPLLRKPAVGNYLVMRHAERIHSGIFIQESKNIKVENINLYHATGLGILAQFSEDLTFDRYRAIPNPNKNRYFGGGDDGLQVSNCKGKITVTNCEFAGLMDDPINVHGTSVQVIEKLSDKQLKCKFMHHQSVGLNWGHPGDKISFIENSVMKSMGLGTVATFRLIDKENFILIFKETIPKDLEIGDALENLTWSPDLYVSNSLFKSCRARGLLVSTPGKVVIENNTFESSGSAILIAGDANNWFESGAVTDVLIKNNVFTDLCNTSSYQFCEGIISIYPEIPVLNDNTPPFHKNIRIEKNEFHPFDYPVLFARSVDGISFTGNSITRSNRFEPYHNRKYTFSFEACKAIDISGNTFSEDVLGKNIQLKWTPENQMKCDLQQNLTVKIQHQ
ncbi:MAG TPA: right-handed parallel beta-helix repeat-containing protein [Draconibacterium sp.]|nr:right-handed parallel beta-helix repeat-containing protein [Draconibacterium sp.]